jgi:hypothetical protein
VEWNFFIVFKLHEVRTPFTISRAASPLNASSKCFELSMNQMNHFSSFNHYANGRSINALCSFTQRKEIKLYFKKVQQSETTKGIPHTTQTSCC